ncbi:MAG: M20/M25/M40 family metallo-hydrolase [Acidaminococcaceae bacterium]
MKKLNKERIYTEFVELVQIPCHTLKEKEIFGALKAKLVALGFTVKQDDAGKKLGGEVGNLWAFLKGNCPTAKRVLLSGHMDCVEPCTGVKPVRRDGNIYSDGTTILGGDDKSGIVGILEGIRMILENEEPHGDIQVLFTIAEEGGVNGSKNMNPAFLNADIGYALDSEGAPGEIVTSAPGQNRLTFKVIGKTAHGGVAPEKGLNAIILAGKALAALEHYGRIDEETTSNIGIIQGGAATNIVPDVVEIFCDARSRNADKLYKQTEYLKKTFTEVVEANGGKVEIKEWVAYPSFALTEADEVIKVAVAAATNGKLPIDITVTGGGSDANFINAAGVPCAILGTGMQEVHTKDEFIKEEDLYNTPLIVYEILKAACQ